MVRAGSNDREVRGPEQPIDLRQQRLGVVVRELAVDLAEERRRRLVLERELRELRARLAAYETFDAGSSAQLERRSS